MRIGVAYYPEHWPADRWPIDARLMREAGLDTVRLAEFAWSRMEPSDGQYRFEWLDAAIDVLALSGLQVMLGTPTEAMPAWLARAYPEALAVGKDGRRVPWGTRRNNCPASATYRRLGLRITEAMAARYATHPAVIGWQIDNELSGPRCYCRECQAAFRAYLKDKFGSIKALNERLGTVFWSHEYGSFEEIEIPVCDEANPGLQLEARRVHSAQSIAFLREQSAALRRLAPHQLQTHNCCGIFVGDIDYYQLVETMDVAGLDYYYNNNRWDDHFRSASYEACAMDFTRSMKRKPFWVMETPTGVIGSATVLRNMHPLEMRRMNFQAVAHGADALFWFRWRTGRFGWEQLHDGILGHDGAPNRRYREVSRVARELRAIAPALEGSTVKAEAAILYTYDNRWALGVQPNARGFDYSETMLAFHRGLRAQGVDVDLVRDAAHLGAYKVLVVPTAYVMMPDLADAIMAFARQGGVVLATARTAVMNEDFVAHERPVPGLFCEAAGIRVEDYEALLEPHDVSFGAELGGGVHKARLFADWIIPSTATPLAHYKAPHLKPYAAITANRIGKGLFVYLGTFLESADALRAVINLLLKEAGLVAPVPDLPFGVDLSIRQGPQGKVVFLLNHNDEAVDLDVSRLGPCRDLLADAPVSGRLVIPGGDLAVLAAPLAERNRGIRVTVEATPRESLF